MTDDTFDVTEPRFENALRAVLNEQAAVDVPQSLHLSSSWRSRRVASSCCRRRRRRLRSAAPARERLNRPLRGNGPRRCRRPALG